MTNFRSILLITSVLLLITNVPVFASSFVVGLIHIEAEVREPIFCVPACDGTTVEVSLWPREQDDFPLAIHNIANIAQTVLVSIHVSPEDGLDVVLARPETGSDNLFEIPAKSLVFTEVLLTADPGAAPQVYDIEIEVKRVPGP